MNFKLNILAHPKVFPNIPSSWLKIHFCTVFSVSWYTEDFLKRGHNVIIFWRWLLIVDVKIFKKDSNFFEVNMRKINFGSSFRLIIIIQWILFTTINKRQKFYKWDKDDILLNFLLNLRFADWQKILRGGEKTLSYPLFGTPLYLRRVWTWVGPLVKGCI